MVGEESGANWRREKRLKVEGGRLKGAEKNVYALRGPAWGCGELRWFGTSSEEMGGRAGERLEGYGRGA